MDALDVGEVSAETYENKAVEMCPPGPAWPRTVGSSLRKVLGAWSEEWARIHNRVVVAVAERDPRTATETLVDWERDFGLPEACQNGAPTTTGERRAAIYAKMLATGGSAPNYFKAVALAAGFAIEIEEPTAFVADGSGVDTPLYDDEWQYAWIVTGSTAELTVLRTADDEDFPLCRVNDPLTSYEGVELECVLGRIAPSHTYLVFFYDDADLL